MVTTVWGVSNTSQSQVPAASLSPTSGTAPQTGTAAPCLTRCPPPSQVFGSPMGPGGSSSSTPLLPGMAGTGSGISSPPFLPQQPFAEGAPGKGYVQPGVYSRSAYPSGPGFAAR